MACIPSQASFQNNHHFGSIQISSEESFKPSNLPSPKRSLMKQTHPIPMMLSDRDNRKYDAIHSETGSILKRDSDICAYYPSYVLSNPIHPTTFPMPPETMLTGIRSKRDSMNERCCGPSNDILSLGIPFPIPYDFSLVLAALAFQEARTLLHVTEEAAHISQPHRFQQLSLHTSSKHSKNDPSKANDKIRREPSNGLNHNPVRKGCLMDPVASVGFLDRFKQLRGRGYSLQDVKGYVALLSLDQKGSRWLQRELDVSGIFGSNQIFREVLDNALLLSRDVFGNYVVQKTIENVDQNDKDAFGIALKNQMRRLSFDVYGCRVAQKLIEHVRTDIAADLAKELEDVVLSCVLDTHASHVIQKCIQYLPSELISFIFDALCGKAREIGCHAMGCRVLQRLIEYCSLKKLREAILDELLDCFTKLASSEYGNYVVQHLAQHGGPKYRSKVLERFGTHFRLFSHHRYASRVVERFLDHFNSQEKRQMIETMCVIRNGWFANDLWIVEMMRDPFANYIIQKILAVSDLDIQSIFATVILSHRDQVTEGYGKRVVNAVISLGLI